MTGYLCTVVAVVAWGFEYALVKEGVKSLDPLLAGSMIFLAAAVFLASHAAISGEPLAFLRSWRLNMLVGIVGFGCNALWIYGMRTTSVVNAAVLGRADILFTFLLSVPLFRERIRPGAWCYAPLMLCGIILTTRIDISQLRFGVLGDYLILGSAFLLTINVFLIRRAMREIRGVSVALGNVLVNALMFSAAYFLTGDGGGHGFAAVSSRSLLILISCGFCSYLFFAGYYAALRRLKVWEVRLLGLGVPVVAGVAGIAFGENIPGGGQLLGGALVLAGAAGIILSGRTAAAGRAVEIIDAAPRRNPTKDGSITNIKYGVVK